ncbi:MAG: hypothetical protein IJM43_08175 [Bacteroidaceae bacterium]|nr:hypothetical protein [Bacteroidaceae bacterium]
MATEVISIPENNGGNGGTVPAWYPALFGGSGNFGGMGGFGGGILGFLIGLLFSRSGLFGGLFGGNNGVGGGAAGTAYLGNMISNDNGRDLLMQAITSNGERSVSAVQQLSTMIGQDFNLLNGAIQTISSSLATIGANQGLNALQVINAIQSGNASLASQFAQCCCQQQLAMAQQTAAMNQGFAGVQQSIAAKSAADQLANCQQTYNLTDTMNRNYLALDNKIDAMESSRKDREIAEKTAKIAQLESQNFTTGVVAQAVAPIQAQLAAIRSEVDDVKCKLPETMTLPNTQYAIVPNWAANIGSDFVASYWANRLSAATAAATTPVTPATAAK